MISETRIATGKCAVCGAWRFEVECVVLLVMRAGEWVVTRLTCPGCSR